MVLELGRHDQSAVTQRDAASGALQNEVPRRVLDLLGDIDRFDRFGPGPSIVLADPSGPSLVLALHQHELTRLFWFEAGATTEPRPVPVTTGRRHLGSHACRRPAPSGPCP